MATNIIPRRNIKGTNNVHNQQPRPHLPPTREWRRVPRGTVTPGILEDYLPNDSEHRGVNEALTLVAQGLSLRGEDGSLAWSLDLGDLRLDWILPKSERADHVVGPIVTWYGVWPEIKQSARDNAGGEFGAVESGEAQRSVTVRASEPARRAMVIDENYDDGEDDESGQVEKAASQVDGDATMKDT